MMTTNQSRMTFQLNQFYNDRVVGRKLATARSVREVCRCVQDVLREVETQEPRFISSLQEVDGGHFDGVRVLSPTEFEVVLYLNQMGIFNFVDDGAVPGCAVLKLSDGRKRSMSLWVEFITASGYLSARKIRSRFQTLVAQAVEKCSAAAVAGSSATAVGSVSGSAACQQPALVKMMTDTSEVRLRIRDRYVVQITPAFKCVGIWPRSAAHWPSPLAASAPSLVVVGGIRQMSSPPPTVAWPSVGLVAEVKAQGFDLLSKESPYAASGGGTAGREKQPSTDGDAWIISFHQVCEEFDVDLEVLNRGTVRLPITTLSNHFCYWRKLNKFCIATLVLNVPAAYVCPFYVFLLLFVSCIFSTFYVLCLC